MANLKSELDEYMQQKDSRRNYKYFSLPTSFSIPLISPQSSEDSPTESVSWVEQVQKDYCTLVSTIFELSTVHSFALHPLFIHDWLTYTSDLHYVYQW